MKLKRNIFFLLLVLSYFTHAQKKYPKNYFRSPLDIPIVLSGTFGELRNDHFHAGMDLKTQRRNGLKVYATADGYVSKIKVALWGYGKVIYITHPNGYTTVYAHLSKFGKGIQEYIKSIQYEKESYETGSIFPKEGEIPVKKGQVIGYSGDTGGFIAPHLHYEIRDTKTEHIINPMLFGLEVKDLKKPRIRKLMGYAIGNNSHINSGNTQQIIPIKKLNDSSYVSSRITAFGEIGFGINTFDRLGEALNKNGVYSIEMKVNGKRYYYHDVETFSFAESKFINLLIDYEHYKKYKSRVQKTFKENANKLSIYENLVNNGIIDVKHNMNYTVEIIVKDFSDNTSTLKIPVRGKQNASSLKRVIDTSGLKILAGNFHKFVKDGITIAFPKNTFYEDIYLDFDVKNGEVKVHEPNIPLDRHFTITFDSTRYRKKDINKIYIARTNNKKYPKFLKTVKRKDKVFATTKILGKFSILVDEEKPKIYNPNFRNNDWVTNLNYLTIRISDTQSGIKSYKAFIDNEWILMEYNLKKKKLSYDFSDKKLVGSKHIFKLVVSDNVGNTNTYTSTFYRK